jgi:hypothetical protein
MTATIHQLPVPAPSAAPDEDPFIPEVAAALLSAGFPADRIGWLDLPAAAALELAAAMSSAQDLQASRP